MTYFESIGVEHQFNANCIEKANEEFVKSCTKCCTQGKYINCDQCAIDSAHNIVVACLSCKTA